MKVRSLVEASDGRLVGIPPIFRTPEGLRWASLERMVSSMPKSRPPYPEEFRREAVTLVRGGRMIPDVARSLGVSEQSLRNWVKRDQLERRERDDGLTVAEREELRDLRRQVKRLEQERDLLKRAAAFFARETETR
jgi:transposase